MPLAWLAHSLLRHRHDTHGCGRQGPRNARIGIVNPTTARAVRDGRVIKFCQAKLNMTDIPRARKIIDGEEPQLDTDHRRARARGENPRIRASRIGEMFPEDPAHLVDHFRMLLAEVAGGDELLRGGPRDVGALIAHQAVRPMPGR